MDPTKSIHFSLDDDGIGLIEIDLVGKPVNLFSMELLKELSRTLDSLADEKKLKGLIFLSLKKDSFIGGAQIDPDKLFENLDETKRFIQTGRDVFEKITRISVPTLAGIHGPALGGGLELCLACQFRMATSHSKTRLGLPEVMLGILPAWGGTTRLPRLVGLQKSLDLLLTGKQISGKRAFRMGLIDRLATTTKIKPQALAFMKDLIGKGSIFQKKIEHTRMRSQSGLLNWLLEKTPPGRALIFRKARKTVLSKTRNNYPSPIKILDVITKGVSLPLTKALSLEQTAIEALMQEETTRNLMHVFSLRMSAGKGITKSETVFSPKSFEQIGVLGGGAMGAGISQWILGRDIQVRLKDIDESAVGNGIRSIHKLFDKMVSRRQLTPHEKEEKIHRLSVTTDYSGFKNCGIVIEAVAERLDVKKVVIRELQEKSGEGMFFATNTSSLSVTGIAEGSLDPSRVLGLHFFNPVSKMPLVEVVRGRVTSSETLAAGVGFVKQIGKIPLVVSDSPGFLVNRILMAYANEAALLLEEGGDVEEIDAAIEHFGMAMGPFRMMDVVGLDIAFHTGHSIQTALNLDSKQQATIVETLYRSGTLGDKSGGGFYIKKGRGRSANTVGLKQPLSLIRDSKQIIVRTNITRREITDRLLLVMLNTAAWCLENDVVQGPGDVDLGLIMGAGFPPFRAGLLRYFDRVGLARAFEQLVVLGNKRGNRYTPSPYFKDGTLKKFY